ncbi:MAG: ACT domain-containing protein [Gemmatimonadaceae bacterium]
MTWSRTSLLLELLPLRLAVCRLAPDAATPPWAAGSALSCVTRTRSELSVLAEERLVPGDVRAEREYRAFVVNGPLPFDLVGVLASMTAPLADAGVSVFALSTYDTDYVLVKEHDVARAADVLRAEGHVIAGGE